MNVAPITDEGLLLEQVLLRTRGTLPGRRPPLVAIDGLGGAGKTTLARRLAELAEGQSISVDDYVVPQQGSYLPHLRYDVLSRDLVAARESSAKVIVLEGLCIRSVLAKLESVPDVTVYVRRVDEYGEWTDEHYFSEDNDLEEILETFRRLETVPGIGDHDRETARYHILEKPISRADFVYDRVRQPPPGTVASA